MSCIAYVCSRVLLKGSRYSDIDFDRKAYIAISNFENCTFYCQREVLEISDEFFDVVDGLVTIFDRESNFCSCSKCIVEIRLKYSISCEFSDGRPLSCLHQIDTYFNERIRREIRGEYIFQLWDLCRGYLKKYFYSIKGDLMTCFHLNVCKY